MTTVHLIYPHAPRISCPDAIGRKLAERLRPQYRVIHYDYNTIGAITPGDNDVLIGHPHPSGMTLFRRSARLRGWKRVLALCPYAHGDLRLVAFFDSTIAHCDLYLAITGRYWMQTVAQSAYAHWQPKMVQMDLAVDRSDFPVIKTSFNPPGKRRFVYIGHASPYKNPRYLSELARRMPDTGFDWIGSDPNPIAGLNPLGALDFSSPRAREIIAQRDFLITVGRSDPNPTTILESMAFGLIPVCTPQSGYVGYPAILNVPLDDPDAAELVLRELQHAPEQRLLEMQRTNWQELDQHFNWDRFAAQVIEAIESDRSPQLGPISARDRRRIRWAAISSPLSPWRPANAARALARPVVRLIRRLKSPPAPAGQ